MSVYLVHPNHINALVGAAVAWNQPSPIRWHAANTHGVATPDTAQAVAEMLQWANIKSVETDWKEPQDVETIVYRRPEGNPDPVFILRALDGYEYQTCETYDYEQSTASAFVNAVRARAIALLPGMRSAPWSITRNDEWSTDGVRSIAYTKAPQLTVELSHGTGKSIVTGPVTLTFTTADMVAVNTDAAVNTDDPGVMFRDIEYRVHLILIRAHDGTWHHSDNRPTIEHRRRFGAEASPTARNAILAAVHTAVTAAWAPDLNRQAQHADLARKLPDLADQYTAALNMLRTADAALASAWEDYRRVMPR